MTIFLLQAFYINRLPFDTIVLIDLPVLQNAIIVCTPRGGNGNRNGVLIFLLPTNSIVE
jgi:hypothetical protein